MENSKYKGVVCRGSLALGSGCGRCERCEEERRSVDAACQQQRFHLHSQHVQPTFQIVVDAKGYALTSGLMRYTSHCVAAVIGSDAIRPAHWVMREDIYRQLFEMEMSPNAEWLTMLRTEHFHEPTADLYLPGKTVPIGRIVNLKIPEWSL